MNCECKDTSAYKCVHLWIKTRTRGNILGLRGVIHTHTRRHTCALSREQTLYLMSIKRCWLKSQVHSIFPRATFISAPGRRLFSKFEMSPWAESGDSALLFVFPAAPAVLKKKMPLRKPIWAYQPYQLKMNLNSGCRWWYWDNAWWVRKMGGVGNVYYYTVYILCVCVCAYTFHKHKKFQGSIQSNFLGKRQRTTRQEMSTILNVFSWF